MPCKYNDNAPCHNLPCKGCFTYSAIQNDRKRIEQEIYEKLWDKIDIESMETVREIISDKK